MTNGLGVAVCAVRNIETFPDRDVSTDTAAADCTNVQTATGRPASDGNVDVPTGDKSRFSQFDALQIE